jgi:hypothetical protein
MCVRGTFFRGFLTAGTRGTVSSAQRKSGFALRAGEGIVNTLSFNCGSMAAESIFQPFSSEWTRSTLRQELMKESCSTDTSDSSVSDR